jgi:hypothetical protein
MKRGLITLAAALALLVANTAHAGRSCEARPPETHSVQRGLELAQRTQQALDSSGAQVVLLARAGQDLSRYQLRWSHIGWAYKDGAVWRVAHKLNQCGSARGDLYRQGLAEFFLDDPFEYRAAYAVPTPEVQRQLLPILADNQRMQRLHQPEYSMLAYPWAQQYQQSNQWAVETMALAHQPVQRQPGFDRRRAQAWLELQGYEPTTLRLSPLVRLGARLTAANVAFDDHPSEKRYSDRIETITADSVFEWLQRAQLAGAPQEIR